MWGNTVSVSRLVRSKCCHISLFPLSAPSFNSAVSYRYLPLCVIVVHKDRFLCWKWMCKWVYNNNFKHHYRETVAWQGIERLTLFLNVNQNKAGCTFMSDFFFLLAMVKLYISWSVCVIHLILEKLCGLLLQRAQMGLNSAPLRNTISRDQA